MSEFVDQIIGSLRRAKEEGAFVGVYLNPEDPRLSWIGQVVRVDETELVMELFTEAGAPDGYLCHLTEEVWRVDEMAPFLTSMTHRASIYPPSQEPAPTALDACVESCFQNGEVVQLCLPPEGYVPCVILEMSPGRTSGWLRVSKIDPSTGRESSASLLHYDDLSGVRSGCKVSRTLTRLRQGL
jgi:hypothetical protein